MLKDQPLFAIREEPEPLQKGGSFNEPTDLRRELAKLGKVQLRAQAVTESALEEIKKMVEGPRAAFEQFSGAPNDGFIKDLLIVADGLEEAIHAGEAMMKAKHFEELAGNGPQSPLPGSENGWIEGIRIIHHRVYQILEKEGIRPIPSVGEIFDPRVHLAVGVEHTSEVLENTVIEEERKGYKRGNKVIRYAEVAVAKPLSSGEGKEKDEQDHWH